MNLYDNHQNIYFQISAKMYAPDPMAAVIATDGLLDYWYVFCNSFLYLYLFFVDLNDHKLMRDYQQLLPI